MVDNKRLLKNKEGGFSHWCNGCHKLHKINVDIDNQLNGRQWVWNGDVNKATFTPSVRHAIQSSSGNDDICHYIINNGTITYFSDTTHDMKGHTMPLPEIPLEAA